MLLCYITDGRQLRSEAHLLEKIAEAAEASVDFIQLRELHLSARALERLALEAVKLVDQAKSTTRLLINSRIDVALCVGADGVHLRSTDITASEARSICAKATGSTDAIVGVSCHSLQEVLRAEGHGADFAVFGPAFGKLGSNEPPVGIEALTRAAMRGGPIDNKVEAGQSLRMPVLALGGITPENAADCVRAGAAGVAAIRMFQQNNIAELRRHLDATCC